MLSHMPSLSALNEALIFLCLGDTKPSALHIGLLAALVLDLMLDAKVDIYAMNDKCRDVRTT